MKILLMKLSDAEEQLKHFHDEIKKKNNAQFIEELMKEQHNCINQLNRRGL